MAHDAPHVPHAIVRLDIQHGPDSALSYDVPESGFLIGCVPGCDVRLTGVGLPPVLCLVTPGPQGAWLRKLAPAQTLLVNGQPGTGPLLQDGDTLRVGTTTITAHVVLPAAAAAAEADTLAEERAEIEKQTAELNERQQQLEEKTQELEADRVIWYERRQQMERDARQLEEQQRDVAAILADIARQKQAKEGPAPQNSERAEPPEQLEHARAQLRAEVEAETAALRAALQQQADDLARQRKELESSRQDPGGLRQELYDKYRQRSDRVAALEAAVRQAARNLQERKRQLDEEAKTLAAQQQEAAKLQAELDVETNAIAHDRQKLDQEQRRLDQQRQELERSHAARSAELAERTSRFDTEREEFARRRREHETHHQAEILRLDRLQAELDEKQKQTEARASEIESRYEQLQHDSRDLEEQAQQLDEWHRKLTAEAERLSKQAAEVDGRHAELSRRAAAVESQQTVLATLRARLERQQEEARQETQELAEQRLRQEAADADMQRQREELERWHETIEERQRELDQDRQAFEERQSTLERHATEVQQQEEKLTAERQRLHSRATELTTLEAAHARDAELWKTQADQLAQLQEKLTADRQVLREREVELNRIEQAREALQEQLRRRSEELAERQKSLAEQGRLHAEAVAALERRHAEVDRQQQEVHGKVAELEHRQQELTRREETLQRQIERLKETGRKSADARKELHETRTLWLAEQEASRQQLNGVRSLADQARAEAQALIGRLPDLEQRAQAAVDRLAGAREQLREHLAELHGYAREGQDDLDQLRAQVQAESERVRQESLALTRARDEHRLAVTAFRQQVIDWQGQLSEIRRSLAQHETQIERRQAQVEADTARLARQAEELEVQERVVAEQRGEVNRHLADMREWYRKKLRELTERQRGGSVDMAGADNETARDILSLHEDIDPGDRRLGELLQSLQLVEPDTLAALLIDARKQRRSLRQMLLASGCVTLYQLALIETGNLGALMLGPVRVIDRVRATAHEAVYRVFDPRRDGGGYLLLRHLADADLQDAVRPDEFRQRFAVAAAIRHENLATVFEVLDISGRPAVLQEAITGLPATEWPAFVAAPGVLFRLLQQAAFGLQAMHQAGLVHGHLDADHILLTPQGVLKIVGLGEPAWLTGRDKNADEPAADLSALGELFIDCLESASPRRKGGKNKALPDALQDILYRLRRDAGDDRYPSTADLLAELESIADQVPDGTEVWERLLSYVDEQLGNDPGLRQTA